MRKLYEIVGLGGTFDHFHIGHEHFIKFASQFGNHLHIGITHPKLTQNKPFVETIEPYKTRKYYVEKYCKKQQISAAISQLEDIYGPTILEKSKIKALVVTETTVAGAEKINQTRKAMSLQPLPVHVCSMLRDETGQIISSERIRAGEINRKGEVYQQVFQKDLILTQNQRQFFSQPQGEIVDLPDLDNPTPTCVVGDSSLKKFIENSWHYDLGVYDKKQQRQSVSSAIIDSLNPNLTVNNPPGQISTHLAENLQKTLEKKLKHIFVQGEEDLAAVVLALILPLGSAIYYGQPDNGLVKITVSEEIKNDFLKVLR